jgi:Tol biopolymer transport system component
MAAADRDISDLYIKVVGANGESRLTNGPTDSLCPAWSPDGRFIAFLRKLGDTRNDLYLISPLGGSERKVAELETPLYLPCFSWHPSGKWLIVSHRKLPDSSFALFSISIDTGEERQLTFPPKESHVDRDPAVSPRGDAIVFARGGPGLVLADLYLLPLADGLLAKEEPRRLTFDHRSNSQPAWTPDGRAIVFCVGTSHSPNLYEIDFSALGWRPQTEALGFCRRGCQKPVHLRKRTSGILEIHDSR